MAKKMIDVIRSLEGACEAAEKEALNQADNMIKKAEKESQKLVEDSYICALDEKNTAIQTAHKNSARVISEVLLQAEKDCNKIIKTAEKNRSLIVKKVVEEIIA